MMRASFVVLAALSVCGSARAAESYPTKPLRVLAPFPAGSGVDIVARLIAAPLGQALGQPVVVDNRAGASGRIACELVAKAAPDGYTLLLANASTLAMLPSLDTQVAFDPVTSFSPIALVATSANVLVVHPSVSATSMAALIALAKSKPGALNYGSAGSGNSTHLAAELFKMMAGVNLVHVSYKGTPQMMTDLLSGQIQLSFTSLISALPSIHQGRLRALGVTSLRRAASLADVPTISESGLKGYEVAVWQGVVAPARTPQAIVTRLNREIGTIVEAAQTRERLAAQGLEPAFTDPKEFAGYIASESAKWAKVIRHAGIKPD